MDLLAEKLARLEAKLNDFLFLYSELKKENLILKEHVISLESRILYLCETLEEKKIQLDDKNDETLFASLLIEDLLEDLQKVILPKDVNINSFSNSGLFLSVPQKINESGSL